MAYKREFFQLWGYLWGKQKNKMSIDKTDTQHKSYNLDTYPQSWIDYQGVHLWI
jgi:hypothetical protein